MNKTQANLKSIQKAPGSPVCASTAASVLTHTDLGLCFESEATYDRNHAMVD
jgi:hypothetical protein